MYTVAMKKSNTNPLSVQTHFGSILSIRSLYWRRMMTQRMMRWLAVSW